MKTLIKSLQLSSIIIIAVSCVTNIPISKTVSENNKTYQVEYLFEHDGCKVYRFFDRGYYVYFTNCQGEVTSVKADSTKVQTVNIVRNNYPK